MAKKIVKTLMLGALCSTCIATGAHAQENNAIWDRVDVDARTTFQYIGEDNRDLGTSTFSPSDSLSEQLQLLVDVEAAPDTHVFAHGRALNIDGGSGFDDDTGNTITTTNTDGQTFLELRELYLLQENLGGVTPLSLQVGRQRVREPRALWWNSDNDLVRVNWNSTMYNAFLAAGENLGSYRTTTDNDYRPEDEDRFRVFGESSWQYKYDQFLEARFLYENDHSGTLGAGVPTGNGGDIEDQEDMFWAGVRAAGALNEPVANVGQFKYRADLIGLIGEETLQGSAGGVTTGATTDRDVRAWAFDSGVTLDPMARGGTVFTAGYSFASGDDGSGTDTEFRQTDLQGSSSRIGLERQQQRNYGEVFRPELSNMHVVTVGVGQPITDATDIGATYFYYRQDEATANIRRSGLSVNADGTDKDLGQELDVVLNVDVDDEFNFNIPHVDDVNFRIVGGAFMPGDAFEPQGNDNNAYRLFSEVKFNF